MLALTAARVFDGEGLVDRPVVLVDGATIVDVGVAPPAEAEVVDLGDATLLPGLVDTHQHLVFNGVGTLEEQVVTYSDDELRERAVAHAQKALRVGVTTIRDLGDRGYVTLPLRDDPTLPTLLCAGPPVTVVNGHCWYLGGECEPTGITDAVAQRAEHGCDVVKVMVSGGMSTPTYPTHASQFGTAELQTIVDAAHARGLPVAAHCHGIESIRSAIDARVDTIEHCTFFGEDGESHPPAELVEALAASGVVISATLGALPGIPKPPAVERNLATVRATFRRVAELGGLVVAGTDAGVGPPKPHDVLPQAFTDLLDIGISRSRALAAMTSDAARTIGLGRSKGRLGAGYDADVLAVAGDPVTGDGDVLSAAGVWRAGVRVT